MSPGSRPTSAQWRCSTSRLAANCSGATNGAFHPSAYCAAIRSVRFSPCPPIQIGSLGWTGTRLVACLGDPEVGALERRDLVVQQAAQDLHALFHLIESNSGGRERNAERGVLDLRPTGAETHLGAATREVVDGRDRLGQHRRVPVADRVDERTATHARRRQRQCGVHGDALEAIGVVGLPGRAVEVVPDRDPVEAERFDVAVQREQLVGCRLLQADVHAERRGRHGRHGSRVGFGRRDVTHSPHATRDAADRDRARVRDVRFRHRSDAVAGDGTRRTADPLGRRVLRAPRRQRATASCDTTTATPACRPTSTVRPPTRWP